MTPDSKPKYTLTWLILLLLIVLVGASILRFHQFQFRAIPGIVQDKDAWIGFEIGNPTLISGLLPDLAPYHGEITIWGSQIDRVENILVSVISENGQSLSLPIDTVALNKSKILNNSYPNQYFRLGGIPVAIGVFPNSKIEALIQLKVVINGELKSIAARRNYVLQTH